MRAAAGIAPRIACLLLGLAASAFLFGREARACPEQAPESCHRERAGSLLERGQNREAIETLKLAAGRFPESRGITLLLARAYLADGNPLWASRTVAVWLQNHPGDCEAGQWAAWIGLGQGMLEMAREALEAAGCREDERLTGRSELILARIERYEERPDEALARLDRAYAARELFPEDREAVARLKPEIDPWYIPPLAFRLEVSAGWTSNARAGSPTDSSPSGVDARSLFAQAGGYGRFAPDIGLPVRPSLEADLRAVGYAAAAGRDHGYLILSGRPGVLAGGSRWSVLAAYRFETLLLAGGDRYEGGPLFYYAAHRGELEAQPLPWLTLFAGAGRRSFREIGRDRIEVDGGLGGGGRLLADLHLTAAISGRWHDAKNDAYDLHGGTLILSLDYRLPYRLGLRGGISASLDRYPRSAGFFDPLAPAADRRDIVIRPTLGVWAPAWPWARAGLVYEFADRFSTAAPYAFTDHRLMVRLVLPLSVDPWLPRGSAPEGHVPIEWGLTGGDTSGERIQDLLRQDEAVRRGSSCVE